MTLDPDALRVLEIGRAAGGEPFETGSVAAARTAYNASFPTLQGEHEPVAATQERQIDGTNGPKRSASIAASAHRKAGHRRCSTCMAAAGSSATSIRMTRSAA